MRALFVFLLLLLFITPATAQQTSNSCTDQQLEDEHVISQFQQMLKKELMAGLKKGVPEAIDVCQTKAQEIAHGLSQNNIIVGRASLKPRNMTTVVPDWVTPLLANYQQLAREDALPQHITIDNNRSGYVKPIYIQAPCLRCHGEHIAPDIYKKISELYPNDQAVNYKKGQFRGVFWLERTTRPHD